MTQASTWKVYKACLSAFVAENLDVVVMPGFEEQEVLSQRYQQNNAILEMLGYKEGVYLKFSEQVLSLIGCGDWSQQKMVCVSETDEFDIELLSTCLSYVLRALVANASKVIASAVVVMQ
jgi:hypothetical protein